MTERNQIANDNPVCLAEVAIADALGYHASVGCTALVRLDDGREVAIKVHQPGCSASFLASVVVFLQAYTAKMALVDQDRVQRLVDGGGEPDPGDRGTGGTVRHRHREPCQPRR